MMQASDELDSYLHTLLPNGVNLVESLNHQFGCMFGVLSTDHPAAGILRPGGMSLSCQSLLTGLQSAGTTVSAFPQIRLRIT